MRRPKFSSFTRRIDPRQSEAGADGADEPAVYEPGDESGGEKLQEKAVEATAVRLLARREHSTEELKRKLLAKGHPPRIVAAVVEKLGSKRLVSDERFVASFVHHHARRGQGPVRIRAELRQQGIDNASIEREFDNVALDWGQLAAEVRQRKFGSASPRSLGERAKQARFLQYRGFSADHIRVAMSIDPGLDVDLADTNIQETIQGELRGRPQAPDDDPDDLDS